MREVVDAYLVVLKLAVGSTPPARFQEASLVCDGFLLMLSA